MLLEHAHGHEWFDANNLYAHIVHLAVTFSAVGLDRPHGYAGLWHRNSSALVLTFFPTTWNCSKVFALERKHLRRIPALYSRTCGADPGGYDVALGLVRPIPEQWYAIIERSEHIANSTIGLHNLTIGQGLNSHFTFVGEVTVDHVKALIKEYADCDYAKKNAWTCHESKKLTMDSEKFLF